MCWERPCALAGGRDVNGRRAHSSTAQAVRKTQAAKKHDGKEEEPSCLLPVLVMAFSLHEGFGDLGSCFVNSRAPICGGTAVLTDGRLWGEQLFRNVAGCDMK